MLKNPFTPSVIASSPEDFYGRASELNSIEHSIDLGSVAIQGPVGIGKSSLLARAKLQLEGFSSLGAKCRTITAVGHKDIKTVDDAARVILEELIDVDEKRVTFKVGVKGIGVESSKLQSFFKENRHLSALTRLLQKDYIDNMLTEETYLVLAFDEADKCPIPLACLIRNVLTNLQQKGNDRLRFIVSGANPFVREMIDEDHGISRFLYRTIPLRTMSTEDARELVVTKFHKLCKSSDEQGQKLNVDPEVIERVVAFSGGHPHLLQLLGSHLVEHEEDNPDGVIDALDLTGALRGICYVDRRDVYRSTLHLIESLEYMDSLRSLIAGMNPGFPSRIGKIKASEIATPEILHWLVEHDVLSVVSDDYGLNDEFLRIRLEFDSLDSEDEIAERERRLAETGTLLSEEELGLIEWYDHEVNERFDDI